MNDDFFLAWLARECRFQASVHFAPRTRIGYRIVRRVIVTPQDEPELNMWLSTQGVTARVVKDKEQIMRIIRLLTPVKQYVKDTDGMLRIVKLLEVNKRRATYRDIIEAIELIE